MRSLIFPFQPVWHQCAHARTSSRRIHSHISLVFSAYLLCSHTLANSLGSLKLASRSFSRSSKLFVANHPGGASPRKPHSPLRSVLPIRQGKLVRPLFSPSYKSLLPEFFRIHIHTKPPGVWGNIPRPGTLSLRARTIFPAAASRYMLRASPQ